MWAEWMPQAEIIGVDISPLEVVSDERILTIVSDIKNFAPEGKYDVVIDDGSHVAEDIAAAHALLWPHVKPGGWHIVEDLNVQAPDSIALYLVEAALRNLWHEQGDVSEVHCYDQIVFLRKR